MIYWRTILHLAGDSRLRLEQTILIFTTFSQGLLDETLDSLLVERYKSMLRTRVDTLVVDNDTTTQYSVRESLVSVNTLVNSQLDGT